MWDLLIKGDSRENAVALDSEARKFRKSARGFQTKHACHPAIYTAAEKIIMKHGFPQP